MLHVSILLMSLHIKDGSLMISSCSPLLMSYSTEILPFSIRYEINVFGPGPSLTTPRSKGLSCELLSIYCSLVIAAFVNPIGLENIGWRYYIVCKSRVIQIPAKGVY
jgi:hypothetical protein